MSVSNEFDDKKQSSTLSELKGAVQISDLEAIRLDVALMKDAHERRACQAHLAYAEEHSQLAEARLQHEISQYLKDNLGPKSSFDPVPEWATQSYETRRDEIIHRFLASDEGQRAVQERDERQAQLWTRACDRIDAAHQRQDKTVDRAARTVDDRSQTKALKRNFDQARDL